MTLKEIELEYIQKSIFSRLLYDNPTLAVHLLKIVSVQAHTSMVELIGKSSNLPLAEQMMRRLRELAGTCGHSTSQGLKLDLSFTVQDLADSIGCSRQCASRLLKDMEKGSLIRRKGGSVVLTPLALNR